MSVLSLLITILSSSLTGTLLGSYISWKHAEIKDKCSLAIEMHKEFYSKELRSARQDADIALRKYPLWNLERIYNEAPKSEIEGVLLLLNFYKRLWILIKLNKIPPKLAYELFGDLYIWWFDVHLNKRLPLGVWTSYDALLSMRIFFKKKFSNCE